MYNNNLYGFDLVLLFLKKLINIKNYATSPHPSTYFKFHAYCFAYSSIDYIIFQSFESYQKENILIHETKDRKHLKEIESLNENIKSLKSTYEQLLNDYRTLDKTMESKQNDQIRNMKTTYEREIANLNDDYKNKEQQLKGMIL